MTIRDTILRQLIGWSLIVALLLLPIPDSLHGSADDKHAICELFGDGLLELFPLG